MDLDDIAVRLRSRGAWEATDLGFAVARRFWRPLYVAWLLFVLPIFAAATSVGVWFGNLWLPVVAVWLLKPAYDRIPLFVVSRALFGDVPKWRRTLRAATLDSPGSVLLDCTVRRLAPFRAFALPLRELEDLSGSRYRDRKRALLRSNVALPAAALLGVALAFEILVVVSGFFTAHLFAPPEFRTGALFTPPESFTAGEVPPSIVCGVMLGYFVAVSLVEVFYVAGNFGLYINRRIHLEGWDVEIDFKRLARRLQSNVSKSALALVAAAAAALVFASPAPGVAASGPEPREAEGQPNEIADRILENDEFGETREEWVWVRKSPETQPLDSFSMPGLGEGIGAILEMLLWLAVGLAVVAASVFVLREIGWDGTESDDDPSPTPSPEVEPLERDRTFRLPTDVVETAARRWDDGDRVGALSMLYRGTLRALSTHHGIEVGPDMTARECLRAVRRAGGPGEYVGRLGRAWTSIAYANRPPTDDEARELFREWREHFGGRTP